LTIKKWLAVLVLGVVALTGCSSKTPSGGGSGAPPAAGTYATITAQQAKQMMDQSSGYIILDVRTQQEFAQGHIAGAILIPDTQIAAMAPSAIPVKTTVIFAYCRTGVRAAAASQTLAGMGYTNVYDMGGIVNWPYGTVTGS